MREGFSLLYELRKVLSSQKVNMLGMWAGAGTGPRQGSLLEDSEVWFGLCGLPQSPEPDALPSGTLSEDPL